VVSSWRPDWIPSRRRLLQNWRRLSRPLRLGVLYRTKPLSRTYGYDRGQPVNRYYIERFIQRHQAVIQGCVLEIRDSRYTTLYGHDVRRSDVLDIDNDNATATIVADLAAADTIPADTYDCCIVTQTLQYIFDVSRAIGHLHRILRPGGVLLASVPVVERLTRADVGYHDHWRFTPASCLRLFGRQFGERNVLIESPGNVLAAIASLTGMAAEELSETDLNRHDELYPLIVTIRAIKGSAGDLN
jgi:hypothetical protein